MTKKTTPTSAKKSQKLTSLFGTASEVEVSKKLVTKLLQYNMKYEEITKVILSHSERAFLDARLITIQEYYDDIGNAKRSEVEDFLSVVQHSAAAGPLALAGFSFGSFVASHAVARLWSTRDLQKMVLVGTAVGRFEVAALPAASHERTLVIHGEHDDTVALADVMNWARPQSLPITVVPGGSHFFHGQLPLLRGLVVRHLNSTI